MFIKMSKWLVILFLSLVAIAFFSSRVLDLSLAGEKKTAEKFIEKNSIHIVNMEIDVIRPLMTATYLSEFNSYENKKVIEQYVSLGKIKSYGGPIYYGSDTSLGGHSKNQRIFYFLIHVHFEHSDAEIKVSLLKSGDSFLIDKLRVKFY